MKGKKLLLVSFVLLFILPMVGSYLKWGGMPPGYGFFPARKVVDDPPFNLTIFIICSIVAGIFLIFLLFPRLFGFKRYATAVAPTPAKSSYPSWFWPSVVIVCISWLFMWGRFEWAYPAEHFTFVPLWWAFIFVLDGIVYKRNNGVSLIATYPGTMKLLAVTSSFSWFVFEYQNFFVLENWYYPNDKIFSNFGNISWQLLSYTTVLPAIFEWYWLLRTIKPLREKYLNGPRITFSNTALYVFLILGLLLMVLMAYFPHELFWVLWVSLIPALVPAMAITKLWTPFSPIAQRGDWSLILLVALATLVNGFFWEFWNFGSEWIHDDAPTNPNYWKYSVPYVDKFHIFSEMPVLGYFGYLLFGIVCWILWLTMAYLFDFNPSIHQDDGSMEGRS
jgi:hypothetical protein